ncbi:MAG: HAMP domain-containing histidine kinase [Nitrospina sp.]|nr:HAMP domain-containing histidine kinase [Nitrospina sp.]MBT6600635.1 HAMP domain-containing histidine kinase [Nitrospina sp.]
MNRLRALFHPIFVFIGVQIAWIGLMIVWVYWYFKNRQNLAEFTKKLPPELLESDFNLIVLLEGGVLMLVILAGVYVIFVYWNKQSRLYQLQSNFVSSVSHELKSPLASIQLYLETLKYQKVSLEETRDFVETMLSDTERLSDLIDNILESSKSDPKSMQLQFNSVDIIVFLQEIMVHHQKLFEDKQCVIQLEFIDHIKVSIDGRAMRMVFNNLIANALRYSPAGTILKIEVKQTQKICIIDFIDQGFGFDKKELKKVFKKFYRVQNEETQNVEGAGLGLYISRQIIKNHKGKINVFSEGRGKGTRFMLTLPIDQSFIENNPKSESEMD